MTEADFELAVIKLAQWLGYRIYHTRNSKGSVAGYPDLTLTRPGRLIFAELKTDKGIVSPAQRDWINALDQSVSDVETYIWRPADWDELVEVLRPCPA